jgi:pre-mRNA-splicing factor RBM22/SLT11
LLNLPNVHYLAAPTPTQVPDDTSITALWVGGLTGGITDDDLKDQFYHFGELRSIRVVPAQVRLYYNTVK